MNNQFCKFRLSKEIISALSILGYNEPTQIQEEVIPHVLLRRDLVAKAQTGSGKTAAFGIPLCELANWEENSPEVLVLEPTRELTVQVKQEIFHIGRNKRLKVADLFGGFPIDKQIQTLKQKSHIVVGTPGRVMDHIRRGSLEMSKIRYLVIDEADLMLDMGFIDEVGRIIEMLPENTSIMLFSATLGDSLDNLIAKYMKDPVRVTIESETETAELVEQYIVQTEGVNSCLQSGGDDATPDIERGAGNLKYRTFLSVLISENPDSCMIFCGTREMVNVLCRKLRKDGVKAGMIHGEIEQRDRIRTIEDFRAGRFRYLICTDVAARGIDFDNLTHVFNYDFPTAKEAYVHRIGRTGRNGKTGRAISMVTPEDMKMKTQVEEYINIQIQILEAKELEDIRKMPAGKMFFDRQGERPVLKAKKGAGFGKTITRLSISGGKKSKMRAVDIVGTLCSIEGITAEDIGIIDVRESLTYVEILNSKGKKVLDELQTKTIKGKVRKVRVTSV